jgi:hypothetical protein
MIKWLFVLGCLAFPSMAEAQIARSPISALPAGSPLSGSELVPLVQNGRTVQVPVSSVNIAINPLTATCYIGNGSSHPLSTVTSCKGVNTIGFTLGQWQTLLPAALSLSDEIDWASLESLMQAATGPIAIMMPSGEGFFNRALNASVSSVEIFGAGSEANAAQSVGCTWLHFTGGTDGFDVNTGLSFSLRIHDIFMDSTTTTGAPIAFNLGSASMDLFENVAVNGFNNCFKELNPQGDFKLNVRCLNSQAAGTAGIGIGQEYDCTTGCFINHGYSELMNGYQVGYYYHSNNGTSPALEDQALTDSACGAVLDCIKIDSVNTAYGPFNYKFENMSVNAVGHFIFAPECNDLTVTGGNWLQIAAVGTWANGTNKIDLGQASTFCHGVRLENMWFGNQTTATDNSLLTAEADAVDVQFKGNHVETNNWTQSAAWIQIATPATQVVERDTAWTSNFVAIAPPTNAVTSSATSITNKMQSRIIGLPTLTGCGSGPSPTLFAGSDNEQGTVSEGGGAPTGCTINFSSPKRELNPSCVVQGTVSSAVITQTVASVSVLTITHAAGAISFNYRCTPF